MTSSARPARDRLLLLLFPPLALMAPILEAFGTLSIPLVIAPALGLFAGFAGLGLILGGAAALLRPDDRSTWPRHVAYVAALVVALLVILDVAAGGHRLLVWMAATRPGRLVALIGIGAVIFVALWPVRRRIAPVLFVAAAVFFGSTVVTNAGILHGRAAAPPLPAATAPTSATSTDLPPIVYIVIDEAMGVDGLAAAPGGASLARDLRAQFTGRGFRVYSRAFSRHYASSRSIPNTLNFDTHDDSWGQTLHHQEDGRTRSILFERLTQDGYDVVSYGTAHIDFCFTVAARCEVLPSFNPASPYLERLRARDLYHVVSRTFPSSYTVVRGTSLVFALMGWHPSTFAGFDAYAFPRWFDRFEADVVSSPRGRAYFVHLIMPHAPYILDDACRDTGASGEAYYQLHELHGLTPPALDAKRVEGYRHYLPQYRCLAGRLDRVIARLDSLPAFAGATIVLHGDHGSRISAGRYAEDVSDRDIIDNYSAFFAIRRPGVDAGIDERSASVQGLIAEFFGAEDEAAAAEATVAIDSRTSGAVVVRPMPDLARVMEVP